MRSTSPEETVRLARALADAVAAVAVGEGGWEAFPPFAITLSGPLGAGKSVLARAFLEGTGIRTVGSPSFNLLKEYGAPVPGRHLDLYRLERPSDADLDWLAEALAGPGPSVVEWPERAPEVLPEDRLEIAIARPDPRQPELRQMTLRPHGPWGRRVLARLFATGWGTAQGTGGRDAEDRA